jgi:cysteine desulfuration protein SufE
MPYMNDSFNAKIAELKKKFSNCVTPEQRYNKLMEMGRALPPFPEELKTSTHLVQGCQSILHLHAKLEDGKVFFSASADALISAGLAAVLIAVYSGEAPEIILKHSPKFLQELGISTSLSPNRSNGLAHIHLRMRQEALRLSILQPLNI